jgi:cell wall-associated NlpC family hydrolase
VRNFVLAGAFAASLFFVAPAMAEEGRSAIPPGSVGHVLVSEDDLESVSRLYGISVSQLKEANPDLHWREGDLVVIPRPSSPWPSHTVRSGETLWRIGKAYGISVDQLRQANQLGDNTLLPGNVLVLPRAHKPEWSLPETAPVVSAPSVSDSATGSASAEVYGTARPRAAAPPTLQGQWVEVRLPDNRRAWAQVSGLIVGSWQPQPAERVVEVGRGFLGVPYKWGGLDPNGWDCSGFVQEVYRLGGHQVPRLADAQYEACAKVEPDQLQPGDLVFFNTDGSGISHVGIYSGQQRFLHASSSRGVVEDSLEDAYFSTRYVGAGRLPAWAAERRESAQDPLPSPEPSAQD